MGEIRLGTSGWSYQEWVGPFYPDKKTRKLLHYSKVFATAEINSTFYAYPSRGTVFGWVRYTPRHFVFAAKLPQVITHTKKLAVDQGVKYDLNRFLEVVDPLHSARKLPILLIQLPPSLKQDLDLLDAFLGILPEDYRFAIEFRHQSWWNAATWRLLKAYRVANTIVDEPLLPPETVVTTDFAYIRWHGKGRRPWYNYLYSLDELRPWVSTVKAVAAETTSVYGYFNNHYHGYAVENCLQVLKMLEGLTLHQVEAKQRTEQYLGTRAKATTPPLLSFTPGPAEPLSVERLLLSFLDRGRLRRALEIGDDELLFEEEDPNVVKTKIRNYVVTIDVPAKTILHNCIDWSTHRHEKSFCKHLGKVFLTLAEPQATRILKAIHQEKDTWQFLTPSDLSR